MKEYLNSLRFSFCAAFQEKSAEVPTVKSVKGTVEYVIYDPGKIQMCLSAGASDLKTLSQLLVITIPAEASFFECKRDNSMRRSWVLHLCQLIVFCSAILKSLMILLVPTFLIQHQFQKSLLDDGEVFYRLHAWLCHRLF